MSRAWVDWMMKAEELLGTMYFIDELSMSVVIDRMGGGRVGVFTETQAEAFFRGIALYSRDVMYGDRTTADIAVAEEYLIDIGARYWIKNNNMSRFEWRCYILGFCDMVGDEFAGGIPAKQGEDTDL